MQQLVWHKCITLLITLSVPEKVFSRLLLNLMQDGVDQLLQQQEANY